MASYSCKSWSSLEIIIFYLLPFRSKKKKKKNKDEDIIEQAKISSSSVQETEEQSVKKTAAELAFEKSQERRVSFYKSTI